MDDLNTIRAGIFFVAGVLTILFRKQLNGTRLFMLKKLKWKNRLKNDLDAYYSIGVFFIAVSIIWFLFSVMNFTK